MSQHDFTIDNQTFPNARTDVNNALQALVSNSSGPTQPAITYAFQLWADTTANLVKQRNSANNAWITIGTLGAANWGNAPLANPAFTGNPTAPTPGTGDNDTSIATTAFVQNSMNTRRHIVQDVFAFKDTPSTLNTNLTWTDTGLQAVITPEFANSVILVWVNLTGVDFGNTTTVQSRITSNVGIITFGTHGSVGGGDGAVANLSMMDVHYPGVTTAVTYKAQYYKNQGGAVTVCEASRKSTMLLLELRRY